MALVAVERRDDGVAVVTLNDPERRNAMSLAMSEAIEASLRDLAADDQLRCVVVTGAPPAFSGGGDLGMLEEHTRRARDQGFDATDDMRRYYHRFLALRDLPVPAIAAVNGHAIGAGLCVVLACDLAVVAADAKLGLTFAKLGLHPGMGGSWLLQRMVPAQPARELLYTGRVISGTDAAGYGMALAAVPPDDVLPRALALAADIAASSPVVVRQLKDSLAAAAANDLPSHLDLEASLQAVNYRSDDLVEGLAAVRERRSPHFPGT